MSEALLRQLLAGTLRDPDTGAPVSVPTRSVAIRPSLRGAEADLVAPLDLGSCVAVVSDPATRRVLGERVASALGTIAKVDEIVLADSPYPDMDTVQRVRILAQDATGLVAVGSGTINDVVKYAAFLAGKPFVSFGTAPSMNGYTSMNAAITEHGLKKTLPAAAALGVFLDLDVLSRAPKRMIQAGLGDSLCRATAQADWLLAHLLLDGPYRTLPFALLAEDEAAMVAAPEKLLDGDLGATASLARTLVLSGFGMTICGGSYPASQGEHLIGHFLEMLGDRAWPHSFHGEQIAVTTLTMARIQETLLGAEAPRVAPSRQTEAEFTVRFGAELGAACWKEFAKKALDEERAAAISARLDRGWPDIRGRIAAVCRTSSEIESALTRAGVPTTPEAIHVPAQFYREAVLHGREIRDRFTFLDLAAESGAELGSPGYI